VKVPPPVRKAGLVLHVLTSVGWAGAVIVYLTLGLAAMTSGDTEVVRAAYLSMNWAAWAVLVPLAVTSLATGVFQALSTPWGLFRHYWVIVKLVIAVVATLILVAYTGTLSVFAEVAGRSPLTGPELEFLRNPSVVIHSAGAFMLLLTATVLAVYKPAGLTRHGQRESQRQRIRPRPTG
jgi:DMSO/TMAO reductase YedYZ heme-binding membrane subunit